MSIVDQHGKLLLHVPPPPPPPESDPGVPWGDPYVCCWRRLWPWHKHGRK